MDFKKLDRGWWKSEHNYPSGNVMFKKCLVYTKKVSFKILLC